MNINKGQSVNKRIFTWWELFILITVLVITAAVLTYTIIKIIEYWPLDHCDLDTVGQFFGGLFTPIVASIGVVYLYGTYRIQFCTIESQEQLADMQQTEHAFFTLLDQQQALSNSLTNDFTKVKGKLQKKFQNKTNTISHEDINKAFNTAFSKHAGKFEQYYRHLAVLLECADKFTDKKSLFFSNIIQARMSANELYVSCVYGISNYGYNTLYPLMNKLCLLKSLVSSDDATARFLINTFYSIKDNIDK